MTKPNTIRQVRKSKRTKVLLQSPDASGVDKNHLLYSAYRRACKR